MDVNGKGAVFIKSYNFYDFLGIKLYVRIITQGLGAKSYTFWRLRITSMLLFGTNYTFV